MELLSEVQVSTEEDSEAGCKQISHSSRIWDVQWVGGTVDSNGPGAAQQVPLAWGTVILCQEVCANNHYGVLHYKSYGKSETAVGAVEALSGKGYLGHLQNRPVGGHSGPCCVDEMVSSHLLLRS